MFKVSQRWKHMTFSCLFWAMSSPELYGWPSKLYGWTSKFTGMCRNFLEPLFPHVSLSPASSLLCFSVSLVPDSLVIPCPRWLWIVYLTLNALDKPRWSPKLVHPEKALRWVKETQTPDTIHQIMTKQVKTHNHSSLWIRSILLSLAFVSCNRNMGHCLHGCHLAKEWDRVGA